MQKSTQSTKFYCRNRPETHLHSVLSTPQCALHYTCGFWGHLVDEINSKRQPHSRAILEGVAQASRSVLTSISSITNAIPIIRAYSSGQPLGPISKPIYLLMIELIQILRSSVELYLIHNSIYRPFYFRFCKNETLPKPDCKIFVW